MKCASVSDLHLGYRGAGRTVAGRNQRELDVEAAWFAAVNAIVKAQPGLVTVAGDVFHTVRPNFHAVRAWQQGIRRIIERTSAVVVVIQGNHEGPKTSETCCPNLVVEGEERVHVAVEPGVFRFVPGPWISDPSGTIAVHCLPFVGLGAEQVYSVEPDPTAGTNILLIHAAVRSSARPGALPPMYGGASAYDVARAEGFDAVCCGDFHEFKVLSEAHTLTADDLTWAWGSSPVAFYSGSIERTSSDIWKEEAPKGVVIFDTETKVLEFKEIETRAMLDIVDLEYVGAESLNQFLARLLQDDCRDMLVRLKVEGFPRGDRDAIDWRTVAALKDANVLFHLDLRYAAKDIRDLGDRRERAGRTLGDDAVAFFDADEDAVRDAAFGYLGLEAPALTLT